MSLCDSARDADFCGRKSICGPNLSIIKSLKSWAWIPWGYWVSGTTNFLIILEWGRSCNLLSLPHIDCSPQPSVWAGQNNMSTTNIMLSFTWRRHHRWNLGSTMLLTSKWNLCTGRVYSVFLVHASMGIIYQSVSSFLQALLFTSHAVNCQAAGCEYSVISSVTKAI